MNDAEVVGQSGGSLDQDANRKHEPGLPWPNLQLCRVSALFDFQLGGRT